MRIQCIVSDDLLGSQYFQLDVVLLGESVYTRLRLSYRHSKWNKRSKEPEPINLPFRLSIQLRPQTAPTYSCIRPLWVAPTLINKEAALYLPQYIDYMSKQPIGSSITVPQRKIWSPEQDAILKQIVTSNKSQKWSQIAKIMETEHNIIGRTGKQCRERWHNQLDPTIKNQTWSEEEESKLFEYHNKFGNKWAKIAQMLPGRTDNSIKNHFYCTLRKALRRINKYINLPKNKGKYKEIKSVILSKVIAVAEQKFERRLEVPEQLIDTCCDIKNRLIKYSKDIDTEEQQQEEDLVSLIDSVMEFNKAYKRKKNIKRPAKTETNKSSKQDESQLQDDQDEDNVVLAPGKNLVQQSKSQRPQRERPTPPPQPQIPKAVSIASFTKKPSLRAYLLTPSMEMELEDKLKPQEISGFFPNFQPSSPPRMDGTSNEADNIFSQYINNAQRGFTPVVNNPVWGELRRIESIDFERLVRPHK